MDSPSSFVLAGQDGGRHVILRAYLERTGRCRFGMHLMQPSASEIHAGNHRASFCPRNANPEWRRFDFVAGFARRGARRDIDGREASRIYGCLSSPSQSSGMS